MAKKMTTSIYLDPFMQKRLKVLADGRGESVSGFVNNILRDVLPRMTAGQKFYEIQVRPLAVA